MWTIDVFTSDHDDVKRGILCTKVSRVHLSTVDFPDRIDAEATAVLMALSIHGGMATSITHCI